MKLKDILAKVAKSEKLTDEESKFLASYDPDEATNNAAAAARRKAEQDAEEAKKAKADLEKQLADLTARLDATSKSKMSDAEKAKADLDALLKKIADLETKWTAAEAEKSKLARKAKVDSVIQRSGIKFADGIDHGILTTALAGLFEGMQDADLDREDAVKPVIERFRAANKAAIVDTSGHGAGGTPRVGDSHVSGGKDLRSVSADERAKQLTGKQ